MGVPYDYGFRIYNPGIAKFLSVDPLTKSYPWYTPYQFAGNKPINSIDIDGLEEIWTEKARRITDEIDAMLQSQTAQEVYASGIGQRDALHNNLFIGIPDLSRRLRIIDPLDQFPTPELKKAYLRGRIQGDAISIANAIVEIGGGNAVATGGLATGPGAIVVSSAGAAVALHGTGVGTFALLDIYKSYRLYNSIEEDYPEDYSTNNTENKSATYNTEREARNLAREKIGKDPVEISPGKMRSKDGRWQYRAKPNDLEGHGLEDTPHIHLEKLNPKTGEVLENWHLRWKQKP